MHDFAPADTTRNTDAVKRVWKCGVHALYLSAEFSDSVNLSLRIGMFDMPRGGRVFVRRVCECKYMWWSVWCTTLGTVTLCGVCSKLWFSGYPKPDAVSTTLESTTSPKPRQHNVARQPPTLRKMQRQYLCTSLRSYCMALVSMCVWSDWSLNEPTFLQLAIRLNPIDRYLCLWK